MTGGSARKRGVSVPISDTSGRIVVERRAGSGSDSWVSTCSLVILSCLDLCRSFLILFVVTVVY